VLWATRASIAAHGFNDERKRAISSSTLFRVSESFINRSWYSAGGEIELMTSDPGLSCPQHVSEPSGTVKGLNEGERFADPAFGAVLADWIEGERAKIDPVV